jgi:hypothetical protein
MFKKQQRRGGHPGALGEVLSDYQERHQPYNPSAADSQAVVSYARARP